MLHTGAELLLDLYDCGSPVLNDADVLERVLLDGIRLAGFEVVERVVHRFPDRGTTLVLILAQSHVALHVWPEARFIAVDVYTCGDATVSSALQTLGRHLAEQFQARSVESRLVERGLDKSTLPDI